MRKPLLLATVIILAAGSGFAQSPLAGKWVTDRPSDPLPITNAQRKQSTELIVAIEGGKASGTLSIGGLGGTYYTFKDAKVNANIIKFQPDSNASERTWTIEQVDDNTVLLYRGPLPLVGTNVLDLIAVLGAKPLTVPVNRPSQPPVAVASLFGDVRDTSRALVPGVTVTATNVETSVVATQLTNEVGRYNISSLVPGRYTITAALSGFASAFVENVSVDRGDTTLQQDFTLGLRSAPASPSAATCTPYGGMDWCVVLHRMR